MSRSCFSGRLSLAAVAALMLGATALSSAAHAQQTNSFNFGGTGGFGGRGGSGGDPGGDPGGQATDPGLRTGAAGAGGSLPGLSPAEQAFFTAAKTVFQEVDDVPAGLGPRFNMDSCGGCHAYPATGGSSPTTNPQVAVATANGAKNTVPSFITTNGPVREVRFVKNPDGTADGGVHDLFVITGRTDAQGCNITQPNFAQAVATNNAIFRIPTPTFGLGLVEGVSDTGLQNAFSGQAQLRSSLGISGSFNHSGNTGNITRFGWKAQNPSLLVFAGEAYDVEQGVTNDAFPEEREDNPGCQFNGRPESTTNLTNTTNSGSPASDFSQDIVNQAAFMRMLAPPTPTTSTTASNGGTGGTGGTTIASNSSVLNGLGGSGTPSGGSTATVARGQQVFSNIGCQACHIINQTTGKTTMTGQSNKQFQPFSDFAVHTMGTGLADNVSQGSANGQQFRSAPLWGVGQRTFFLHDGRTNDLKVAIQDHASSGSEANQVVQHFNMLSTSDQQSLLDYLRSL